MVQRTGVCGEAVTRDASIRGGDADDAAERCRLPDGSAGIRSERQHRGSLCHGCGRAAARPAGNAVGRYRIAYGAEGRVFVGRSHGELVAVGLSQDDAARRFDPCHRRRVVRRDIVRQQLRSAGGLDAAGEDHVLDGDGHAGERTRVFAAGDLFIHLPRTGQRPFGREAQIGVGPGIFLFGEPQGLPGQFDRAKGASRQPIPDTVDR